MFRRSEDRRRVSLDCGDLVITKQSMKDECDIHNILRQYSRTGVITHIAAAKPRFEDLPDVVDYQEGLNIIMEASASFAALPAIVREHFANDPARFLAAFQDKAQHDYLRSVGLLQPLRAEPATPVADPPASSP